MSFSLFRKKPSPELKRKAISLQSPRLDSRDLDMQARIRLSQPLCNKGQNSCSGAREGEDESPEYVQVNAIVRKDSTASKRRASGSLRSLLSCQTLDHGLNSV